jgi:hypothetical protein
LLVKVHPVATAAAVAVNLIPHAPASTAWRAVAVVVLAVMVAVVVDLVAVVAVAAAVVVALAAAVVVAMVAAVAVHSAANQHINNLPFDGRQWPDHLTSSLYFVTRGVWSPCPAFWCATF